MNDTILTYIRDDSDGIAVREATGLDSEHNVYEIPRDLYDRYTAARIAYDTAAEELYENHIHPREEATRQRRLKSMADSYRSIYESHVKQHGALTEDQQ